jgi:hypothetical protein
MIGNFLGQLTGVLKWHVRKYLSEIFFSQVCVKRPTTKMPTKKKGDTQRGRQGKRPTNENNYNFTILY